MTKALAVLAIWLFAAWDITGALAESQGTVNLSDIPVDDYPVCQLEDCSDVPNQEGLWLDTDTGSWYFEQGESSWLVVDDTVTK